MASSRPERVRHLRKSKLEMLVRFDDTSVATDSAASVIPTLARTLLQRPRLLERIGRTPSASITIVTAPAGYGKSTLLTQWAQLADHPVGWISLSNQSNSMPTLFAAISQTIDTAIGIHEPVVSLDAILQTLQSVSVGGQHLTLVFDDFHLIANPDIREAVGVLFNSLPQGISVIVLSRADLPLPLGRMRANGQVQHLTETDLTFTGAEVSFLAELVAPRHLSLNQLTTLHRQTEGWIAGIRLALTSLEHINAKDVWSIVDTWQTRSWLDDYFVAEVLATLRPEVRDFVERTVFLNELTADLCNAVLGISHSESLLQEIVSSVVFLRVVDGVKVAYHSLFVESVKRIVGKRQSEGDLRDRHLHAARWCSRQGQHEAAFGYAVAAEEWDLAIAEFRVFSLPLFLRSRFQPLQYWLRQLPEDRVLADPFIGYSFIGSLIYSGQIREGSDIYAKVEARWKHSSDPYARGLASLCDAFFASMNGNLSLSLHHHYVALSLIPITAASERLMAWAGMIHAERIMGNDDIAELAYRQANHLRLRLPADQSTWIVFIEFDRANNFALRGDLASALDLYQHELATLSAIYKHQEARVRFRIASIFLEMNSLEEATYEANEIVRLLEGEAIHLWHQEALMVVAGIQDANGDLAAMEVTLRRVRTVYEEFGGQHNLHRLEAMEAQLWIRTNRIALTRAWAERTNPDAYQDLRIFGDANPRLMLVQIALLEEDTAHARRILTPLVDRAIETKRWAELVSLSMWDVVVCLHERRADAAIASLQVALEHGRPGKFVRSFATSGHDLRPFLRGSIASLSREDADYVRHLIRSTVWTAPDDINALAELPGEQLSRREHEVLELMSLRLTNHEIGQRLFISETTVKRHVGRVLAKLKVTDRRAAVQQAHVRGLL